MPFLNPEEIGDYYVKHFIIDMPQNYKLITFSHYIVDTYICNDAIFPPHIGMGVTF